MEFDEAKRVLIDGYSHAGLRVQDEGRQLNVMIDQHPYTVAEADIASYAELYPAFASLSVAPCDCGICSTEFREQAVVPIDPPPVTFLGT